MVSKLAALLLVLGVLGAFLNTAVYAQPAVAQEINVAATDDDGRQADDILQRRAGLQVEDVSMNVALTELRYTSGVSLAFSPNLLPRDRRVTCHCRFETLQNTLERLLEGTGLRFTALGEQVLIEKQPVVRPTIRPQLANGGKFAEAVLATTMARTVPFAERLTGTIVGRVTDIQTQAPITGAHVTIPEQGLSSITDGSGRFRVANVQAGSHTVVVEQIGYRSAERAVTVSSGGTSEVNVELRIEPLHLDAIIATGTAGTARRRELGNTVGEIRVANIVEPHTSVDQLLHARTPGMTVNLGSGTGIGGGAQIRLRGNVSVGMSNQPIVYVDGVRTRSEGYARVGELPEGGDASRRGSNTQASPLNDINPNDIERIEVIKGAAATTLYGSEAAAGVIQIFTKRGQQGPARWTAQIDQGFDRMPKLGPSPNPYINFDPWLRTGRRQNYLLSVGGGTEDVRYYVSGNFEDRTGYVPLEESQRYGVRGNVDFRPAGQLHVDVQAAYSNTDIGHVTQGQNGRGWATNVYRGDQNYLNSGAKEDVDHFLEWRIFRQIDRMTGGVAFRHTPWERFNHRLRIGYDRASNENQNIRPLGLATYPLGAISTLNVTNTHLTTEYMANLTVRPSEETRVQFSAGGEFITATEVGIGAQGEELPGPGIDLTVTSAARTLGTERRHKVTTGGLFVQGLFDYRDVYFLTLGLCLDGSSVFGEDLGIQTYPKASFSYMVSDESFWNVPWADEFRVRLAYGWAGRAPGAFDAVRTWEAVGWGGLPAFYPLNSGNAELGPERTAEFEGGFDLGLFDGRLTSEVTYYRQRTEDALIAVQPARSQGFTNPQLQNIGSLENKGWEIGVHGTVIERRTLGWDLGLTVATNHSKVLDLGGAPEFAVGETRLRGRIMEGHPAPVIVGQRLVNPNEFADPIFEDHIFGPNYPTHTIGASATLRFPHGIQLSSRGEYQGGHYMSVGAVGNTVRRGVRGWGICEPSMQLRDEGRRDEVIASKRALCFGEYWNTARTIFPADHFKLRDLTLSAPVDRFLPGISTAQFTASLINGWTWTNSEWPMMDPEMTDDEQMESPVRGIYGEHLPPPITVMTSIRINF